MERPVTTPPAPTLPLVNGARLPHLGLGTWPLDDDGAEKAVAMAIGAGYRLVDTAENYENERGVGRGLRATGVPREELFVTTKFNRRWHGHRCRGGGSPRSTGSSSRATRRSGAGATCSMSPSSS